MSAVTQATLPSRPQQMEQDMIPCNINTCNKSNIHAQYDAD